MMGTKLNWVRVGLIAALLLSLGAGAHAVTINWVTVGDPGNAGDTRYPSFFIPQVGAVAYSYRIDKYETTNSQYTAFLNAVAATDPNSLYNTNMGDDVNYAGILRVGSPGSYTYSVRSGRGNWPVNYVSWYDALRMANWLQNGQPTGAQGPGTTEKGAYDMSLGDSVVRGAGARFWLTSEDEWYKAAYYKAGGTNAGYWDYATQSNAVPNRYSAGSPGLPTVQTDPNSANYWHPLGAHVDTPTEVGAYLLASSAYGTFDQGGNLWEWNERVMSTSYRGVRGGSWAPGAGAYDLWASTRLLLYPSYVGDSVGFRLAGSLDTGAIPEPATVSLLGIAVAAMLRRRRRQA